MKGNVKCIIVDDHPAIRFALNLVLSREGVQVIAECSTGEEAHSAICRLKPDLVLIDLDLPVIDGCTVIERLQHHELSCKFIVISAINNKHLIAKVRATGAHAFLHKSESLEQLPIILKLVFSGYRYFTEQVVDISRKHYEENNTIISNLSERELSVFQRLIKGESNISIANKMALSPKTISTYKSRIYEKLGVNTLIELIEVARREGF